jgi:hypothetical protein
VAVGCGNKTLAKANRYGLSWCEREKSEMERRSSGTGVGKYGTCGGRVVDGGLGQRRSGVRARRTHTRRNVRGTME